MTEQVHGLVYTIQTFCLDEVFESNFNAPHCKMHNLTNVNLLKVTFIYIYFIWIFFLDSKCCEGKTRHCCFFLTRKAHTTLLSAYEAKQLCNDGVALSAALTHLFIYSLMPCSAVCAEPVTSQQGSC